MIDIYTCIEKLGDFSKNSDITRGSLPQNTRYFYLPTYLILIYLYTLALATVSNNYFLILFNQFYELWVFPAYLGIFYK